LVPLGFRSLGGEHLAKTDGVEQVVLFSGKADAPTEFGLSEPAASERGNVGHRAALQFTSRWIEKLESLTICPLLPLAPLPLPFWPNWNARNARDWSRAPKTPAQDNRSGDSDFLELRGLMERYPRAAQDSHEAPLG